ncbi:MAG: 3D domain-containing protein, partial [Planctomycetota bacterium]
RYFAFRGSRKTRHAARLVVGGAMVLALGAGAGLGSMLWTAVSEGREAEPLMHVESKPVVETAAATVETADENEAPSRPVPTMSVVEQAAVQHTNDDTTRGSDDAGFVGNIPSAEGLEVGDEPGVTFDGRPLRVAKVLRMKTTAYSPDEQSCGVWADGQTASGKSVWTNAGKLVAADTSVLPFGTLVSIPGYDAGNPVPVLDRGGAIKGNRLDLLYPTHDVALQWGVQDHDVIVWEYAD